MLEGGINDARTGMPPGIPEGAICVQRFDDSLNSAIHITYRISLRSSSMPEPRDPLLKVFIICIQTRTTKIIQSFNFLWRGVEKKSLRRFFKASLKAFFNYPPKQQSRVQQRV